jgi:hypothetical protein
VREGTEHIVNGGIPAVAPMQSRQCNHPIRIFPFVPRLAGDAQADTLLASFGSCEREEASAYSHIIRALGRPPSLHSRTQVRYRPASEQLNHYRRMFTPPSISKNAPMITVLPQVGVAHKRGPLMFEK